MKDFFTEQLVKREISKKDNMIRAVFFGVYTALIIYIIFTFIVRAGNDGNISFFIIGLLIATLIAFIGYRQLTGFNIEFEYSYTNGTLDIDIIRNRSRRKNIFTGSVADFEIMAHINDRDHLSSYKELPSVDYSSGNSNVSDNTYVFVTVYNGNKKRFIIEPKPEMLKAMLTDLTPRRLHIKK